MVWGRLQIYLQKLLTLPLQSREVGRLWLLCFANIGIIVLLGVLMMALSGKVEFFILTAVMMIGAGGMIIFLLLTIQQLNLAMKHQHTEAMAYGSLAIPLLMITPKLQFSHKNQKAHEVCWWASTISALRSALVSDGDKAELERLIAGLNKQIPETVSLRLRRDKGEEIWRVRTTPVGKNALWHCHNITRGEGEKEANISQANVLTAILDQTTEGLFSLSEDGVVRFCNEKFSQWLGYERAGVIGLPFSHFLLKARPRDVTHPFEIQGKCDFMTATSRVKTAYLEQTQLPFEGGILTHSVAYLSPECTSKADLKKILDMTPLPVAYLDGKGIIQETNTLFRERLAQNGESLQGDSFLDFVADFQREEVENSLQTLVKNSDEGIAFDIQLTDSKESIVSAYIAPLFVKAKRGFFVQFHDIAEHKQFEGQLVQSQKMQAVGQLAGGIAHDFNNLLTAMIGFCDLLLLRHTPGDHSFTDVMQIKQNANRAANLVRQLLAFSRQQKLKPKILDITETLTELSAFLRRLLGANVELKIKHARDLGLVLVDQGQFEQVITNMVVNARDALDGSGTIVLTTQNREFKKAKRYGHDVILDRIFDPFFSTKEVGSGTGLGLSTVYGIVKQTGGFIHVESTLGKGTVFSVYFPLYVGEAGEVKPDPRTKELIPPHDLTGSHTILLVEDEDAVRLFSARALRSKGYTVIEAVNGMEALELMNAQREQIDLVISDVVMPHMDGPVFVTEMNKLKNPPKVLFISGYTEDAFSKHFDDETEIHFLAKPFSLSDLAIQVKSILNEVDAASESQERTDVLGISPSAEMAT